MMLSGLARHQARGVGEKDNGGRGGGVELARVKWRRRWGWHSGQLFVSLAGSRPEQLPFLFLAAALCLVQRDDLGSKWRACGQPLLLLQASRPFASCGQIVVTGYSPPASPVKCQKCRYRRLPKLWGLALIHIQRLLLLLLADELVDQVHDG